MESDPNILQSSIYHCISIHALRMESDQWPLVPRLDLIHFYPRSPHGERPSGVYGSVQPLDFYPRSPHGERPLSQPMRTSDNIYFYPRSPHGERLYSAKKTLQAEELSIHALRMESDTQIDTLSLVTDLSIHALRMESDLNIINATTKSTLSIHALRMESDFLQIYILRLG